MRKYAYGSKINPSLNGGDVATTATSTGSGALTGFMVGGPVGAAVGGAMGLVSGLVSAFGKSKSIAAYQEANRQATITNMNSRLDADNLMPTPIGRRTFYAGGGVVPIGSNGQQFVGPSHEDGGIPYTANDEVEGGETGKVSPEGVKVFSDRIKVPNSKMTFADVSLKLMKAKAAIESKLDTNEDHIKNILDGIKHESRLVPLNTAKRRVQIKAEESAKLLNQSSMLDAQLDALFNIQETITGNKPYDPDNDGDNDSSMQTDTDNDVQQHATGGIMNFIKTNPEMSANIGATALDTITQGINAYQAGRLSTPVRGMAPRIRMNANIDNSAELASINSGEMATKDFITNNISNPAMRRAAVINTMINANKSRSQLFTNTANLEQKIQMQNAEYARNEIATNSNNLYQNQVDNYNKAMSGINSTSAISSNTLNNFRTIATQQSQNNSQKIGLLSILSSYPESERNLIMANINKVMPGLNFNFRNTPMRDTTKLNLLPGRSGMLPSTTPRVGLAYKSYSFND